MRSKHRWVRVTALVAGLLMVLAACGGTDVTEDGSDGDGSNEAQTSTDGAETLADFFGYGEDFDEEAAMAEARAEQLAIEEQIATCMAEQGFEYTPYVPEDMFGFFGGPGEDLTEEERMKKYGYGFFTYMLEEAETYDEFEDPYSPENDPNWARMEAMSESEREAYHKALDGDWENYEWEPEYDEDGNEIFSEPDWEAIGGCRIEAEQEMRGGPGFDEEMMAISEQLEPLWEDLFARIEADPRMVEANADWAACMAERGYTFTNQEDIFQYLMEKEEDLWSNQEEFFSDEGSDTSISEFEDFGPFGPGIDEAMIQQLADEELAIAADDWECRGDRSFDELRQEVSEEYEAQFIAENRELLEKQKALFEEAGF